jgi:cation diffusion facilitator CzcD-associated flavoprotein CzcO
MPHLLPPTLFLPIPTQSFLCVLLTDKSRTGWAGLTVAKTYTQVHPDVNLVVLDPANSVGGTWAAHRLYPGLKTNNVLGSYENPDLPMKVEKFGVKPGQHIPGEVVHQYLTDFAKTFDIWRRIRFRTTVEEIQQASNGQWILTISYSADGKDTIRTRKIAVNKLVVATGVTSHPYMPSIPGVETFNTPLFHARDFLQKKDLLKTAKKVIVYGGSKSAVRTFGLLYLVSVFLLIVMCTKCIQSRWL